MKKADLPHPVIGILNTGDISAIIQEAGWVVTQTLKQKTTIDFLPIGNDPFSQFMLMSTKPFYVK